MQHTEWEFSDVCGELNREVLKYKVLKTWYIRDWLHVNMQVMCIPVCCRRGHFTAQINHIVLYD